MVWSTDSREPTGQRPCPRGALGDSSPQDQTHHYLLCRLSSVYKRERPRQGRQEWVLSKQVPPKKLTFLDVLASPLPRSGSPARISDCPPRSFRPLTPRPRLLPLHWKAQTHHKCGQEPLSSEPTELLGSGPGFLLRPLDILGSLIGAFGRPRPSGRSPGHHAQ